MNRRIIALLLSALPLLSCAGCGTHDPGQQAIATALALDGGGEEWTLTAELAGLKQDEPPDSVLLSASATIPEAALERLSLRVGHVVWCAQTGVLVFGKTAAAQGLGMTTLRLLRHGPPGPNVLLAVADGEGGAALTAPPALGTLRGGALSEALTRAVGRSAVPDGSLRSFCSAVAEPGMEAVLPLLSVPRDGPPAPAGTALFVGDRLAGTLNVEETRWLLLLSGSAEKATFSVRGVPLTLEHASRKVYPGEQTALILLSLRLSDAGDEALRAAVEADVRRGCEAVLRRLRELRCDAVGLGAELHRTAPRLWQSCAEDWPQRFARLTVTVDVRSTSAPRESDNG